MKLSSFFYSLHYVAIFCFIGTCSSIYPNDLETGKMTGTIECHRKLGGVFGLKLSEFYAYMEDSSPSPVQFHSAETKTDV